MKIAKEDFGLWNEAVLTSTTLLASLLLFDWIVSYPSDEVLHAAAGHWCHWGVWSPVRQSDGGFYKLPSEPRAIQGWLLMSILICCPPQTSTLQFCSWTRRWSLRSNQLWLVSSSFTQISLMSYLHIEDKVIVDRLIWWIDKSIIYWIWILRNKVLESQ